MPKPFRSLICVLLLCFATSGHTDTTLEVAVQSPAGSGTQTFHVIGQQLRTDIQLGLTRSSVLYDASTDQLTLIDHQEQAFVRIAPEQAARLGQQLTPDQATPPELVDTGQVETLGNRVNCRVYQVYRGERLVRETCLADFQHLGLTPEEYRVFSGLLTALARMAGNSPPDTLRPAGTIPLRTVDYDSTGQSEVTELRSVKRGTGGVSFQVPRGYVEESPF